MKSKLGKILSLVLSLAMVASFMVMPAVGASGEEVLTETFEAGTDKMSMNGFNGWTSTVAAANNFVLDAAATIADDKGNKTLLYTKKSGSNNSQDVSAGKAFDTPFSGGVLSATIRLRHNGGLKEAIVMLAGSKYGDETKTGWLNTVFDFSGNRIYFGGSTWVTPFTFTVGQWYTFEIAIDTDTQKYALLKDGQFLIPFTDCGGKIDNAALGKTVRSISLKTTRNKAVAEGGGSFSADDIKVRGTTLAGMDADAITLPAEASSGTVTLPSAGTLNGSTIAWASSNPSVISNAGVVTPSTDTQHVTLTATVTKGTQTAQRAFDIEVLGKDIYLEDDYESPQFTSLPIKESTTIEGWNGYKTNAGNSSYTIDTKFDVKAADDNAQNHVLSISRTGEPSEKSSYITLTKDFKAPIGATGKYSVSFRYKKVTSSLGKLNVFLKDSENKTETFTIYPTNACVDLSGGNTTRYYMYVDGVQTKSQLPSGWYDFEFVFDNDAKTFSVYQDGYTLVENVAYTNSNMGNIDKIQFNNTRNEGALGQELYIDDLKVAKLSDLEICRKAAAEAGEGIDGITASSNLTLPTVGYMNAQITWQSSDPSVISGTGAVTPADETKTVTLTATATSGTEHASESFRVKVLGRSCYIDENFDMPESDGTALAVGEDFNGWVFWQANESAKYYADTAYSVVTAKDKNDVDTKVMQAYRTRGGSATINDVAMEACDATLTKNFTPAASTGVTTLSFSYKTNSGIRDFTVNVGGIGLSFNFSSRSIDPVGSSFTRIGPGLPGGYFTSTSWHEAVIKMDHDAGTFTVAIDGDVLGKRNLANVNEAYSFVQFKLGRKTAQAGATLYLDDVVLSQTNDHDYSTAVKSVNIYGGMLSGVTIAGKATAGVTGKAVIALYNGETFVRAFCGELSGLGYNADTTVPVNTSVTPGMTVKVITVNDYVNLVPLMGVYSTTVE